MKSPSVPEEAGFDRSSLIHKECRFLFLLFFILFFSPLTFAQVDPKDLAAVEILSKNHKDEPLVCRSSYHYFTFDKGKNSLEDKVVVVQEDAEVEFLSLKKYASITYPEFYNKFIQLKVFKKDVKMGNKFITSERAGIDRAVTDENIFFDDSRVQYFPIRFSEKGAAARITVKKEYSDGKYLTRLFFHEPYPVNEKVFEFKVPEWMTIDFKAMNFEGQTVEKKQTTKGGHTNYVFIMRNLPAIKSEYRQIGRAYTDPHIVIQIKSFKSKGEMLQGFDQTADVYKWNNRLYNMAGNNSESIKSALSKIIAGKTNDPDKIKSIYYYVQDKIRYIAYEDGYSGYIPASAQDVLTNKYGDCKGMANLLTEMLKLAGYNANFTWIGTRDLPYSQALPALCVNNHAITTLNYNGKEYFLDPTEKYVPFGENAYRIQGKEAMISYGEKFEIKTVPTTIATDHKVLTKANFSLKEEMLTGKVEVTLTGNERKDFHQNYHDLSISARDEFFSSFLEFDNDNIKAFGVQTSDLNNREIPVVISGIIDLGNSVQTISGSKYINLDFFPKTLDKYRPDEKRQTGYDLGYVMSFEDEFTLTIPENSRFSDIPKKLELKYPGYEFSGEYILQGNKVILKKLLVLKSSVIKKKDFTEWIKFLDSIKEFSGYFFSVTTK
jgi:hypothetical protein